MKMRAFIFFVAIALVGAADDVPMEENVLVLSKANFDSVIQTTNYVLVEFYAPWCGHCKALAPEYAKAAKALLDEGSEIKLAKVDATQEQDLAESYGVRGYPTLKLFKNGNPIEYTGGRTSESIVSWLQKKTGPPAIHCTSYSEAQALIEEKKVIVFGFFPDNTTEKAVAFLNTAEAHDEVAFVIVSNDEIIKEMEAQVDDIVLFRNFEEPRVKFEGKKYDEESIKKWVFLYTMPSIVEFSHETANKIFGGQIKVHLLVLLSKKNGDFDKYIGELKPFAAAYRDQLLTVAVDTDEVDHQRILEFFGNKQEDVPFVRLIALEEDMAKYKPPTDEISANVIEEFVQSYFDGKLKPHLLSQDLPEDWNASPVKTLVSSNFDEIVFDTNKKALVEFFAPWCGHCKQLAPIYDKLGEHFKDDSDIVIAKLDATLNQLEHTKISSFPTIKFYRKNNEEVEYNGERTLEALIQFIESDGVSPDPVPTEESDDEEKQPEKDEL